MIKILSMNPFYTKVSGTKLRIVFVYQCLSIEKDGEVYHFIPIEGKEITVNMNTHQVENLAEVLVFQKGSNFVRLPIYQFLLVTNVQDFLNPIINRAKGSPPTIEEELVDSAIVESESKRSEEYVGVKKLNKETELTFEEIMQFHKEAYIDRCLDNRDYDAIHDVM